MSKLYCFLIFGILIVLSQSADNGGIPTDFHYGRSTHFGLTFGGACGFGLYQVCGSELRYDEQSNTQCDAFCKAYPLLCKDPEGITYRGNYAAPNGHYYSQHWDSLEGSKDNYLSCGECFEVTKVKEDGSEYKPGEDGYQPPIILSLIDSCPCAANPKWCCKREADDCSDISSWKYGCPLPEGSIHLDLSDCAMARLQKGTPNGEMDQGIIPNKYRRVPCPHLGNIYVWLHDYTSQYWLSLSVVNAAGYGSIAVLEAKNDKGEWVKLQRDQQYSSEEERYGSWETPEGSGPFSVPIDLRLTDGAGNTIEAEQAIKSFTPPAGSIQGYNYIDIGVNFPEVPYPS